MQSTQTAGGSNLEENKIVLNFVRTKTGGSDPVQVKVKPTTVLGKIYDNLATHWGVNKAQLRFSFDGDALSHSVTVKDAGLDDGDQVDVTEELTGGN